MRVLEESLASPHPLGGLLPAIYHDDGFSQRFTQGLDTVLASLLSTLDNLEFYFDPELAPADFVDWLAGWLAIPAGDAGSLSERRQMIRRIPDLYRRRGTRGGLSDHIELVFHVRPEILETGGTWLSGSDGRPVESSEPRLVVRVRVEDTRSFPTEALSAFVEANKPAHVPHSVEVLPVGGSSVGVPDGSPAGSPSTGGEGRLPAVRRSPYRGYGPVRKGDM